MFPPISPPTVYVYGNLFGDWRNIEVVRVWPTTDLGPYWSDSWCWSLTHDGQGYLASGGAGGRHPLLYGLNANGVVDGSTMGFVGGNIKNLAGDAVSFTANDGLYSREWGHIATAWDGSNIYTYVNGVPCSMLAHTTGRYTQSSSVADRTLFIGGSTHSNWKGKIASFRLFENLFAHPEGNAKVAFAPQWPPNPYVQNGSNQGKGCHILYNLVRSSPYNPGQITDEAPLQFSDGVETKNHPGVFRGAADPQRFPYWVAAPDFPFQRPDMAPIIPGNFQGAVPAAPVGVAIRDSFTRRSKTLCFFENPSLGSTENGTAGPLPWNEGCVAPGGTTTKLFGILHGQAVCLSQERCVAWVVAPSQPVDIRITRRYSDQSSPRPFGIAFRVVDRSNFHVAYITGNTNSSRRLHIGRFVAGVYSEFSDDACSTNWSILKILDLGGGVIQGWVDSTQIRELTGQSNDQTVKGVGMFPTPTGTVPEGLDRGDDFEVRF